MLSKRRINIALPCAKKLCEGNVLPSARITYKVGNNRSFPRHQIQPYTKLIKAILSNTPLFIANCGNYRLNIGVNWMSMTAPVKRWPFADIIDSNTHSQTFTFVLGKNSLNIESHKFHSTSVGDNQESASCINIRLLY